MTIRKCDRCQQEMPPTPESISAVLVEGQQRWRVTVLAPRDVDLCIQCRQHIVAKGEMLRRLTEGEVMGRPLDQVAGV